MSASPWLPYLNGHVALTNTEGALQPCITTASLSSGGGWGSTKTTPSKPQNFQGTKSSQSMRDISPPCHKVAATYSEPLHSGWHTLAGRVMLSHASPGNTSALKALGKFAGRRASASISVFHHTHNCLSTELHSCMWWQSPLSSEGGIFWGRLAQHALVTQSSPSCSPFT